MHRILTCGLAMLGGASVVLVVAPAGEAQVREPVSVVQTGWWSLRPGAPLPPGAFQVAQNPNGTGDMTVAAVKFRVNAPKLGSVLFVMGEAVSPLNFRNETANIVACLSRADWAPANPGLLANAPQRDCSKTIQMRRSATLKSWSADLLPLLDGKTGLVSVLFVPGAPAEGSLPITSIEDLPIQLPSLPLPAIGGVPIPPPLPAPLAYPELPASIAIPVDLGFTAEMSNIQVASALPDIGDSLDAAPPLDSGLIPSGDLTFDAAPPLTGFAPAPSVATAEGQVAAPPRLVTSQGPGKPWGRVWGLLPLALLIGAGATLVRRAAIWGGS